MERSEIRGTVVEDPHCAALHAGYPHFLRDTRLAAIDKFWARQ
jgi:hypothetical protein